MSMRPVQLGSQVELYPLKAWSRLPKDVKLEDLWQLVGSQVERHINHLPMWKVFALVYYEGLAHGSQTMQRMLTEASPTSPTT